MAIRKVQFHYLETEQDSCYALLWEQDGEMLVLGLWCPVLGVKCKREPVSISLYLEQRGSGLFGHRPLSGNQ